MSAFESGQLNLCFHGAKFDFQCTLTFRNCGPEKWKYSRNPPASIITRENQEDEDFAKKGTLSCLN